MSIPGLVDGCLICNGRGQVAEGTTCPVCGGTGVATAEQSAQHRQLLVDAAVKAATDRFAQAGTHAAEGILRGLAQARDDARETTARAGEVLSALKAARQSAWIAQQAALRVMGAETLVTRAEAAASAVATRLAAPMAIPLDAPDPTDPPPGIVLPAGMGGEIYYLDSLLVRQLDVWGNLNVGGAGGLLTNPMTTLGDLITGGALGAAQRLAVGANNQVLTVVGGVPAWANTAASLTNPMTAANDLIVGGAAGTPARLAVGTLAQVLTVTAGGVAWANSPAGFANPMSAPGDLILGGAAGAAGRLAIGAAGQVLTVAGGTAVWQTNPAGFTNPMTTAGDLIVGSAGGAAVRLAAGQQGQVLSSINGQPTWVNPALAFVILFPTGDQTGAGDDAGFAIALASLPNGGVIQLAPGAFYTRTGWVVPAQTTVSPFGSAIAGNPVSVQGAGPASTLFPVGAAITGVSYHRTTGYGAQYGLPADPSVGYLRDFVIDGTLATGASIGVDVGDGRGISVDLTVQNFATAGAIGFNLVKRVFWTEKCWFKCQSYNNSTAVVIGNPLALADVSQEYNFYDIIMFCNTNQQGVVVSGGTNLGGCKIEIRGNMALTSSTSGTGVPTNNVAMISFIGTGSQGGSRLFQGRIWTKVEGNPGNGIGNVYPYGVYSDGNGYLREVSGHICHTLNGSGVTAGPGSVLNGAEFSFTGAVSGDPALQSGTFTGAPGSQATILTNPPFPGLGTLQQNYGPACLVCVAGGTVSGISVDGVATGLTTGAFYVPAGGSITVSGTVAPTTYNWVPVTQNAF